MGILFNLMKKSSIIVFCLSAMMIAHGQYPLDDTLPVQTDPGEKWYGAAVNTGDLMPFKEGFSLNLYADAKGNQAAPLLISTGGKYVWSANPFAFCIVNNQLNIFGYKEPIYTEKAGSTLAEAYAAVSKKFFPPSGKMPNTLLFTQPQFNTWIELIYNQNQKDILKYAHDIVDNGFTPGVLMIDDNWAPYYGKFEFRKDRFPDAVAMMAELHQLGFKVMIWICPFISPDMEVFRDLQTKRLLLMNNKGNKNLAWKEAADPAIVSWWNGYSGVMDFTNPESIQWFNRQLDYMVNHYGIDGFKLDAGDPEFYTGNVVSFKEATPNDHSFLWGEFGIRYPLNEYRAMWKRGGEPLAERLRDKAHNWPDLKKLIPHITAAGLLGYPFACPDLIGGGEFSSFLDGAIIDQELIVRSAQCHALMPMMQFSVAPWRVLEKPYLQAVKNAVALRKVFTPAILSLAHQSAVNGLPIVRNMEYAFPHQGLEGCQDQFMLGDSIMVTPMIERGHSRLVKFPAGTWKADDGKIIKGPATLTIDVPMERLPWFRLVRKSGKAVRK
ncbi:MAG: glycoside hydrolase family 31 protein [Flavitalea sp.]